MTERPLPRRLWPSPPAKAAALAAALIAGLGTSACKPAVQHAAVPPQPVQVVTVHFAPAAKSWSYVGIARARFEVDLGFRVAGKIAARLVDVGATVVPGQPVALLDPTDFRLALEAQEAELSAARSSRDQAAAAEARFRTLQLQGHVSKAAEEQRIAAADEARGRLERAERNLDLARRQLGYTELAADRAGVVSALPVEAGQVVAAGQSVARLAALEEIEAEVPVPEHMVESVRAATASAEVWSSAGTRMPATLREMSPEADRVSRTYTARFRLPATAAVALGRTVTIHLAEPGSATVARIPLSAVTSDSRGAAVYAVDPSGTRVLRTPVTVASLGAAEATIASGITEGTRIVSLGLHMLDEGKPVRVVENRTAQR